MKESGCNGLESRSLYQEINSAIRLVIRVNLQLIGPLIDSYNVTSCSWLCICNQAKQHMFDNAMQHTDPYDFTHINNHYNQ